MSTLSLGVMQLSLVTVYRRREPHLRTLLSWWEQERTTLSHCEWIVIEADEKPSPGLEQDLERHHVRYQYLLNPGILHKTKALNIGLQLAQGNYLVPFDVDLIPFRNTLKRHLQLATLSPQVLITGYRLMLPYQTFAMSQINQVLEHATTAPEDQPTALRKHLLQGERFGVMPLFNRDRLLEIQGWDEEFIGWGAEDQDLIERYLGETGYLCRSPQLVYLHLHHEAETQWSESEVVTSNRHKYYQKRSQTSKSLVPNLHSDIDHLSILGQ